jgi:hypothetical protein
MFIHFEQIYHVWEGHLRKIPVERQKISRPDRRMKFNLKTGIFRKYPSQLTQIILRPLSVLSLDEGLNSPCDKNVSAALWKREPISDDYLPNMRKAVLSISGNVYKQQEMEINKLINDV